ncbi:MAG: hypothetical protein GXP39_00225 [Chloroflexi bacterium]|nr:hypothetical protein [Chloroflexota bacterium]
MLDESSASSTPSAAQSVHIRRARLYPYPDLTKLWLRAELSPFTTPPNLEVIVHDPDGEVATSMYLVEWRDPYVSLTLHLRRAPQPGGRYTAELILTEKGEKLLDHKRVAFDLTFVEPDAEDLAPGSPA